MADKNVAERSLPPMPQLLRTSDDVGIDVEEEARRHLNDPNWDSRASSSRRTLRVQNVSNDAELLETKVLGTNQVPVEVDREEPPPDFEASASSEARSADLSSSFSAPSTEELGYEE